MPGEFAENITTEYTDLSQVVIGDRIHIGSTILEVTQIGKECHQRCHIYEQVGDCVMPREGIFARVIEGGRIWVGNPVLINPSKIHSEPTPQSHNHECSE
jgi:MOSC domain-containing protein YiiM